MRPREHDVPVTVRGAGTGNYGQCVPLRGGIVLDLSLMDKLEEITATAWRLPAGPAAGRAGDGGAQAGVGAAHVSLDAGEGFGGRFLGGGSGGIGSVAHGGLRDFDTVRAFEVVTMEEEPRVVLHEGKAVHEILHAWGTNGMLTRIWFALTPAVEWTQFTAAFDTYDEGFTFAESIAVDAEWTKRLVDGFRVADPFVLHAGQASGREGKALVLIMIATAQLEALARARAEKAGGEVTFTGAYEGPRTQPLLSDYTWNHTTLWAMKADPAYTYLQCGFSPTDCREQFRAAARALWRRRFCSTSNL